ncbi:MAG: dihydropteroate synthase [Candidatus Gastranaerophilaceae bacterium]
MHDFLMKELVNTDIESELVNIGFDAVYAKKAKDKFRYKTFKIFDITVAQANIIKQTALSVGADCGTHREVITGKQAISSCILGGSYSQLKKISEKLKLQPFGLKFLAEKIEENLKDVKEPKTKIMGVLNVTENSFSDGGKYCSYENAVKHLHELVEDGANIIDIGAESTKPYSNPVSAEDQLEKIEPILKYIKEKNIKIPVSIDTRSAEVAKRCIELGADIINDVSGFDYDKNMPDVIAASDVKVIIQHSQGTPDIMQDKPHYENLMDEIFINLKNKVDFALSKGIKKENIIVDPGIGFGKTRENNFEILRRWKEFKTIGCPVLIGLSRKSLLNMKEADNEDKDVYSLALDAVLMSENIDYVRVHNVKIHKIFQNMLG